MHITCVASEHYNVKADSSQANSYYNRVSSAEPKEATAGKDNCNCFNFVNETKRLDRFGALRFLHASARYIAAYIMAYTRQQLV